MLVIHDEYPDASPGVRPDCQQGGQLAPVTRLGAVLGHRHGHGVVLGSGCPPLRTLRAILSRPRVATRFSAPNGHERPVRATGSQGPARTKVHPTTAPPAPICGMGAVACGSRARRHGMSERSLPPRFLIIRRALAGFCLSGGAWGG